MNAFDDVTGEWGYIDHESGQFITLPVLVDTGGYPFDEPVSGARRCKQGRNER